jgi:hypothetical protein
MTRYACHLCDLIFFWIPPEDGSYCIEYSVSADLIAELYFPYGNRIYYYFSLIQLIPTWGIRKNVFYEDMTKIWSSSLEFKHYSKKIKKMLSFT